jgi:outer membrane immunogenic protein
MLRPIIATLALAASVSSLAAADMPLRQAPPPFQSAFSWNGLYLGANVGGGWSNTTNNFSTAAFPAFASVDNHLAGAIAGGQVGFNWQQGPYVFGLEADLQWSGMRGGLDAPCPPGLCAGLAASFNQRMPWFGTIRGRIGYAQTGWLLYATGGYAYARLETHAFASAGGLSADIHNNENRSGWTVGGGIEVAFTQNWSGKVEYLYMNFGSRDQAFALTGLPVVTDSLHLYSNIVRAGVNYRF